MFHVWINMVARLILSLIVVLAALSCREKTPAELEKALFSDFLRPAEESTLDLAVIEESLFEVQRGRNTTGRAVHIGGGYYLTACHVIDQTDDGSRWHIIPQLMREETGSGKPFEILDCDKKTDAAFVREVGAPFGDEASFQLANFRPRVGDPVSQFLVGHGGHTEHKGWSQKYSGADLYDESKVIKEIGEFVLHPGSKLFENRGLVFEARDDFKKGLPEIFPDDFVLTSVSTYNGESGGPTFFREGVNKYKLIGVISASRSTDEPIMTPNNPLGYKYYVRTWGFTIPHDAIRAMIDKYLK